MKFVPLALSPLLLALAANAQTAPLQGFLFNWDRPTIGAHFDLVTRWNTTAESDMTRVDTDDFREWGRDTTGQVKVRGFITWIYDSNYATTESYSLVGHAEDTANANFPLATAAFTVPNIPMPPGTTGNVYRVGGTLSQAVSIPGTGDVFVGIGLPAMVAPTSPYDGLWLGYIGRNDPTQAPATYDEPGPRGQLGAGIARDDYVVYISGGTANYGPASATSLSQLAFDVMVDGGMVGGVALTQTNQTSLTPSNAPYGTSDFLSGLHPDVNGFNAGRADNVGFGVTHHTGQMPVGSPVFILLAFGPSPVGPLALSSFGAVDPVNSAGLVCLDFTNAATFLTFSQAGIFTTMGEAQLMLTLTPQTRSILTSMASPFDFWWQGFAVDTTNTGAGFEVRATGCVLQHVK